MFRRLMVLLLVGSLLGFLPKTAAAREICFPSDKTPYCFDDAFSDYWEENGGLPVFGYPITPAANELNRDTEITYWTQWAERNRFEVHPENLGTPYEILLGRLGADRLAQLGRTPDPREAGPQEGCLWFEVTGHNVCNQQGDLGFRTYWENHGLNIPGLNTYERSLQLFGYPLTEPKLETNSSGDTVLTQWFERARFEWHPNNPDEFKVLLGLLGKEVLANMIQPAPGKIIFMSDRTGNGDIYTIEPDGSELTRVTNATNIELSPVWSPNRDKVAFVRFEGAFTSIYVMNADGSGIARIGAGNLFDSAPSWSPDGRKLAFSSFVDNSTDIYVIDADGSNRLRMTTSNLHERSPVWAPDGSKIAFVSTLTQALDGPTDIFTMNLDGSNVVNLTNDAMIESDPDWAPDGSKIAFSARENTGDITIDPVVGNIFVINADGSGRSQLTTTNGAHPAWSPDSSRLVYMGFVDTGLGVDIFIMDADGSDPIRLTTTSNNIEPDW